MLAPSRMDADEDAELKPEGTISGEYEGERMGFNGTLELRERRTCEAGTRPTHGCAPARPGHSFP